MKGKTTFTSSEIDELRSLIDLKCKSSNKSDKKSIRDKMREMKFYITDFASNITSVSEFDKLINQGIIKISDSYSNHNVKESFKTEVSAVCEEKSSKECVCENKDIKTGLDAIVDEDSRVLILGSLPGNESLKKQQYYAKQGNRFWKIIYGLFGEDEIHNEYEKRVKFLRDNHIAIWDVLSSAMRDGSLDSNIEQESYNDLRGLLGKYPQIKLIALNGKKAKECFNCLSQKQDLGKAVDTITLYSSSGANRQYSMDEMISNWSRIKKY